MLKLISQKHLIELIILKISRQGNRLYILESIPFFMLKTKVFIFVIFWKIHFAEPLILWQFHII